MRESKKQAKESVLLPYNVYPPWSGFSQLYSFMENGEWVWTRYFYLHKKW